jgi:hypothetical protein
MTDLDQQIAIATVCGWTEIEPCTCFDWRVRGFEPISGAHKKHLPDYLNDLNAMHEAEKMLFTLEDDPRYQTRVELKGLTSLNPLAQAWHATARQKAEAFLKTLNLWKD